MLICPLLANTESGWILGVYEAELSACLQETTTTKKSEFTWKKKYSIQQSLLCFKEVFILRVHLRFTAFLCTSWGSSQSQSVGTLRRCKAGFYQGSEWFLNKATCCFPPSWKAPDLGPKSRATGPVLFIFPLLWLASQVLFLHKTVPCLFHLN